MKPILLTLALFVAVAGFAQKVESLPAPNAKKMLKMSLGQTLQQRQSIREYSTKAIDSQTLGTLLWAACGINRPADGRITAPSAINAQDITVYVCRADGAWRYEPKDHSLVLVTAQDLRPAVAGRQAFAAEAPVCLVLVSDLGKFRMPNPHMELGAMDAGYVSENICLACTALGLATVPRASMDKNALTEALGLNEKQILMLNNPVGWPK